MRLLERHSIAIDVYIHSRRRLLRLLWSTLPDLTLKHDFEVKVKSSLGAFDEDGT